MFNGEDREKVIGKKRRVSRVCGTKIKGTNVIVGYQKETGKSREEK